MSKEEKRKRLSNLHIDLISLVDEGANPEADVVLIKAAPKSLEHSLNAIYAAVQQRLGSSAYVMATFSDRVIVDDGGKLYSYPYTVASDGTVSFGERSDSEMMFKSGKPALPHLRNALQSAADAAAVGAGNTKETNEMEETQKQLDELQKQLGELQGKLTEAVTAREAAEAKAADLEKRVAELEPKPDPVEKALAEIPEPVRKRLEETEAELSKMRDERDIEVRKAFLGQVENLKLGLEDGAQFLQRVAKALKPEDYAKFEEVLKAANEAAKTMTQTVGKSGHGAPHSVQDEVFAKAEAFVKDGKAKNRSDATALLFQEEPELYKRYNAETARRLKEEE